MKLSYSMLVHNEDDSLQKLIDFLNGFMDQDITTKDKRNIEILLIWCRMCRDIGSFKPSTKQQRKWLKVNIKSDQVFSQN